MDIELAAREQFNPGAPVSEANQAATGRKRWTVDRGHMTARYRNAPSESGGAERAGHQARAAQRREGRPER